MATRAYGRLLEAGYRWRLLLILTCIATLNFADRSVLSVTMVLVKQDLHLSDGQLGLLQGLSFALLYTLLGIPIGRLAERFDRRLILACAVAVFSLMTLLCGVASSFIQLFILRMMVGVGEAGFMPPTSSLLSDHYPATKRASALSIVMLGSPFGSMTGNIVGGIIADHWGWRTAFVVMGVPGFLMAALLLIVLVEPPRGLADGLTAAERTPPPPFGETLNYVFRKPAFVHLTMAATLASFGLVSIGQFQALYLRRTFDLSLTMAGTINGLTTVVALSAGTLCGGFVSDYLGRRDRRWSTWAPTAALLVAACGYCFGLTRSSLPFYVAGMAMGASSLLFYYAPTYANVQNLVGPRMRATAVAIVAMTSGLLGSGLGPTVVGSISDLYAAQAFGGAIGVCHSAVATVGDLAARCHAAEVIGLRYALITTTVCAMPWGALHFWLASRTLLRDYFVAEG
jgi:MFS family permease